MSSVTRAIALLIAAVALSSCSATGAALDRFADEAESRSNCHTSTGEFVAAPSCTITYTRQESTTTTTTTTTTSTPPKADDQA